MRMKFSEAMTAIQGGGKTRRQAWNDEVYLAIGKPSNNRIEGYRPAIRMYNYDSSIFMSDGWFIDGDDKEYRFHEIVERLYMGAKARLKEWGGGFIYYDREEKDLVYHSMEEFFFVPEFKDLIADDWVMIE